MTAYAQITEPFGEGLPNEQERTAARTLRDMIAMLAQEGHDLTLRDASGEEATIALGPAMTAMLVSVLRPFASGDPVALVPVSRELTTQEAADVLNVSRPHLIKLLEAGEIAYHKTGTHRRVRFADLITYQQQRDMQRDAALRKVAEADGDLI